LIICVTLEYILLLVQRCAVTSGLRKKVIFTAFNAIFGKIQIQPTYSQLNFRSIDLIDLINFQPGYKGFREIVSFIILSQYS